MTVNCSASGTNSLNRSSDFQNWTGTRTRNAFAHAVSAYSRGARVVPQELGYTFLNLRAPTLATVKGDALTRSFCKSFLLALAPDYSNLLLPLAD